MFFVENLTTTYNNEIITTDEPLAANSTQHVLCHSACNLFLHQSSDDEKFTPIFLFSLGVVLLVSVLASSFVVFFRYYQYSQQQEKKRKEFLKDEKTWAHPFEDILVVVDEIKSVELTEIRPTTIPT
ncbi:unnamed protein product [Adineta ricciae]|uniref:Uncharacterized protein n=1 Tax=Adineta ricciae TaxID=249248 RepID=A0A813YPI2_ADIRI|nr:unnamed protein product [Adineta ricciae]CAF1248562.1 unnamed protein product [Adineta ricciae]